MTSSFELFQQQIDSALSLIERNSDFEKTQHNQHLLSEVLDTPSLLTRCEKVCKEYEAEKPTIRVIHHLACSGGTVISKCISAMPNVYLLSEVHPLTDMAARKDKPKYSPSDLISLTKYAGIPNQRELAIKIFRSSVEQINQHVSRMGGVLVLREHTHADFSTPGVIPNKSTIVTLLEQDYDVKSVLTIRNPIDSYASLVKNNWVHFNPKTFEEYCRRFLLMLELFKSDQVVKYEEIIASPQNEFMRICNLLDIPYDSCFEDIFGLFTVTGDSGRGADFLSERERIVPENILDEVKKSKSFEIIENIGLYNLCGE